MKSQASGEIFHAPSPSFDIQALEEILKALPCQRPLMPLSDVATEPIATNN